MAENQCKSVNDLLRGFKLDYFSTRPKTPESLATWETEYRWVLTKLPLDQPLTVDLLKEFILTKEPNSRQRRRYALACAKLADFAGLDHDLRRYAGKYSINQLNPRDIPSDEDIVTVWKSIPSVEWQWAYGMLAAYGLRNCELFRLNLSELPMLIVDSAKGGRDRVTFPLYPEWFDLFRLENCHLPACTGKNNSLLGAKVSKAFRQYQLPFTPYCLRHAWARRSIEFGWDLSLAASQMGHSLKVHSEIYHLWISRDTYKRTYDRLISNPFRPCPPLGLSPLTNSHKVGITPGENESNLDSVGGVNE